MSRFEPGYFFHERYILQSLIGEGGMSEVWKVLDTFLNNKVYAIKIFSYDGRLIDRVKEAFRNEFILTNEFDHPNLLRLRHFDIDPESSSLYLVMKFYQKGTAENIIFKNNQPVLESDVVKFIRDASLALMTLHSHSPAIIHQDIKPDNFLIDDNNSFVLSDFGVSIRKRETDVILNSNSDLNAGGLHYMAPERFTGALGNRNQDVFSLGVTIYQIATGRLPFLNFGTAILLQGFPVPDIDASFLYSNGLNRICKACMSINPESRPKASDLYNWSEFFLSNGYWPNAMDDEGDNQIKQLFFEAEGLFNRVQDFHNNHKSRSLKSIKRHLEMIDNSIEYYSNSISLNPVQISYKQNNAIQLRNSLDKELKKKRKSIMVFFSIGVFCISAIFFISVWGVKKTESKSKEIVTDSISQVSQTESEDKIVSNKTNSTDSAKTIKADDTIMTAKTTSAIESNRTKNSPITKSPANESIDNKVVSDSKIHNCYINPDNNERIRIFFTDILPKNKINNTNYKNLLQKIVNDLVINFPKKSTNEYSYVCTHKNAFLDELFKYSITNNLIELKNKINTQCPD